jgi:Transglycosylase SLT domain
MMEMKWISGVGNDARKRKLPAFGGVFIALALSGCISPQSGDEMSFVSPPMQWDHHPKGEDWTESTLVAVSTKDPLLSQRVPADIDTWCPGYAEAPIEERRAFWTGLLSAVAKYESTWNPGASGGGGRWIGLMQISPRSAANYGCEATSVGALKDGEANLECAVEIMSEQVAKDGLVAGGGNRGIGRDWAPLRNDTKRSAMAAWTREQPYCQAG